jgi:hypothetical protein
MREQDPYNTSTPSFGDQLASTPDVNVAWPLDNNDTYKAVFEQSPTPLEDQPASTQDGTWPPDDDLRNALDCDVAKGCKIISRPDVF